MTSTAEAAASEGTGEGPRTWRRVGVLRWYSSFLNFLETLICALILHLVFTLLLLMLPTALVRTLGSVADGRLLTAGPLLLAAVIAALIWRADVDVSADGRLLRLRRGPFRGKSLLRLHELGEVGLVYRGLRLSSTTHNFFHGLRLSDDSTAVVLPHPLFGQTELVAVLHEAVSRFEQREDSTSDAQESLLEEALEASLLEVWRQTRLGLAATGLVALSLAALLVH